jgi:hypothetical protein
MEKYALSTHATDYGSAIQQVSSTDQGLQLLEIVTSTKYTFVATCGKLHNFYNHKKIVTTMLLYLLDTCFSFSNSFLTL